MPDLEEENILEKQKRRLEQVERHCIFHVHG